MLWKSGGVEVLKRNLGWGNRKGGRKLDYATVWLGNGDGEEYDEIGYQFSFWWICKGNSNKYASLYLFFSFSQVETQR